MKVILFDVDGVFLSEERYFDATALTVWEMLYSPAYLNLPGEEFDVHVTDEAISRIRDEVFFKERVLELIKTRGINANWDMVYLVFGYQLARLLIELYKHDAHKVKELIESDINYDSIVQLRELAKNVTFHVAFADFYHTMSATQVEKHELVTHLNTIVYHETGLQTDVFSPSSELWKLCRETFQEWYVGEELIIESIGRNSRQAGKKGFMSDEIPLVPVDKLSDTLQSLTDKGYCLGVGTGRPALETVNPLKTINIFHFFDPNRVVTADDVLNAEMRFPSNKSLAKPHPFTYMKGYLGNGANDEQCLNYPLPIRNKEDCLIVGDSIADILAAKSIGCQFAAVLTGHKGKKAKAEFERWGADYILDDVTEIARIL